MSFTRSRTAVIASAVFLALQFFTISSSSAGDLPSGERVLGHGHVAIEPAYNADTGEIMYLLTPTGAPFPSHANWHAISPLYMVVYPPGTEGTFNCEGVPGNCPDHAGLAAAVATGNFPGVDGVPSVYGHDPSAVPGHDHVADPPGAPDWNVAWEVIEVLFTSQDAVTQLTTDEQIEQAVKDGDAIEIDLGVAFNCSVVSPRVYWHGTPIGD